MAFNAFASSATLGFGGGSTPAGGFGFGNLGSVASTAPPGAGGFSATATSVPALGFNFSAGASTSAASAPVPTGTTIGLGGFGAGNAASPSGPSASGFSTALQPPANTATPFGTSGFGPEAAASAAAPGTAAPAASTPFATASTLAAPISGGGGFGGTTTSAAAAPFSGFSTTTSTTLAAPVDATPATAPASALPASGAFGFAVAPAASAPTAKAPVCFGPFGGAAAAATPSADGAKTSSNGGFGLSTGIGAALNAASPLGDGGTSGLAAAPASFGGKSLSLAPAPAAVPATGGFGVTLANPTSAGAGAATAATLPAAGCGFNFGNTGAETASSDAAKAVGATASSAATASPPAAATGGSTVFTAAGATSSETRAEKAPLLSTAAAAAASPSQEFGGKGLGAVLRKLDIDVALDQRNFADLARHVVARDRQIMARGRELTEVQSVVKDALTAAKSAEATLAECKQRQAVLSEYLQSLEDKVQPYYAQWEQQQQHHSTDPRGVDQQRAVTYDNVIALLEEVQGVEEKVGRAIRQHNHSRNELLGLSEIEGTMRLIDGQLCALQCCSALASALELELDRLLGKAA
ncbi:Nsp1-like C-terminal region containing protein, putative [Leishmania lindenbergi]|uniref:Nsp1-like C-terminal region containing protein n=1 Tax=Leishmania lindenbergi TaxID=651832 RepID=A0AAW3A2C0_9TRYP